MSTGLLLGSSLADVASLDTKQRDLGAPNPGLGIPPNKVLPIIVASAMGKTNPVAYEPVMRIAIHARHTGRQ